jgi:hypothetical protein
MGRILLLNELWDEWDQDYMGRGVLSVVGVECGVVSDPGGCANT